MRNYKNLLGKVEKYEKMLSNKISDMKRCEKNALFPKTYYNKEQSWVLRSCRTNPVCETENGAKRNIRETTLFASRKLNAQIQYLCNDF